MKKQSSLIRYRHR